jgi:hypothetical protein
MSARTRKSAWVLTDDEKLNIASSTVVIFILAFLVAFVYFGDAPRQLPVLLTTAANVYFLRCASLGSSKYVEIILSTMFFTFAVILNLVP